MTDLASDDPALAFESLLRWYAAMGVDAAVDETPHNRFTQPAVPQPPAPVRASAPSISSARPALAAPDSPPASTDEQVREAVARAASAMDLAALREAFETLPGLGLAKAARMIFAGGTPGAPLMLIGAAPESDDERQGEIFAGAAGRLLDAMLRAIGLDRGGVYLANVVPWRPPGNRAPTPLELSLCLPFTRRHIALARPRAILCLGERAAQPLLGTSDPISRLRGRWLSYAGGDAPTKLLATFSPSYLLSQPLQKRRAWADLQMVAAELASPSTG